MAIALLTTLVVTIWDGAGLFLDAFGSDGSLPSFAGRLEVWQNTITALTDYGMLGLGLGNFVVVTSAYFETFRHTITHAHNLLLQITVDLGVPGVLIYGWLLVQTLRVLVTTIRRGGYLTQTTDDDEPPHSRREQSRQRRHRRRQAALRWALAVGLTGAFTALLVHGLVDAVAWGTKLAFIPWLLFALTALLWRQEQVGGPT
jgi:putative inorganic carbon (HCO3(-)) transporter